MSKVGKKVITRFPPSPTGGLHVGGARTALFNYLFTKQTNGEMYLRFEDTDKERSKKEYEKDITDALEWLGIDYHGPFRQSERTALYKRHIEDMIKKDYAYISKEEEGASDSVIRFKNPNKVVLFEDIVRGTIEVDTTDLGDFVIAKNINEPLYHLAVVVDDHDMGVTHVIRGEDHISNTPRQILIQEAIGAERPIYAHIPMILGPDKSKLSKRHGAKSTIEYKDDGFLAEAMINYLALLGWNPGDDREYLSRDELINSFNLEKAQKGGAVFDLEKLKWLNKEHLLKLPGEDFEDGVSLHITEDIKKLPQYSKERLFKVIPLIRERIHTFKDVEKMAQEGELEYFFEKPDYHAESLMWKDEESIENTKKHLEHVSLVLSGIPEEDFFNPVVKKAIWEYAESNGKGNVLWPMRYALSGVSRSPDPLTLAEVLGKVETIARLNDAIAKI